MSGSIEAAATMDCATTLFAPVEAAAAAASRSATWLGLGLGLGVEGLERGSRGVAWRGVAWRGVGWDRMGRGEAEWMRVDGVGWLRV